MNDRLSASLLGGWLVHEGLPAFEACYWGCEPFARGGMARKLADCFDWSRLETMLASASAEVILLSSGSEVVCPPPRDLNQLRYCFASKIGLTVRGAERFCPISRAVAEDLGRELGPARVHLFATPPQAGSPDLGAGWHYDDEHVFIVQTVGVKDYYFRANTVSTRVAAGKSGFGSHSGERSRLWSARLSPGDVLYLPARWWNTSRSDQDALALSIGVTLPALPPRGMA